MERILPLETRSSEGVTGSPSGTGVRALLWILIAASLVGCKRPNPDGSSGEDGGRPAHGVETPETRVDPETPPDRVDSPGAVDSPVPTRPSTADAQEREERARLQEILGLALYPGGLQIPSLSRETQGDVRVVLTTEDAPERVVRFYEEQTGKMAQLTELSDGNIHDIILASESRVEGGAIPTHGVQIRPTPKWHLRDGVVGRTSIILFRRLR